MLNNRTYPPYPNKFKAGDVAVSRTNVNFMDGTRHTEGQKIVIEENTVSYYNVWHHVYDKLKWCAESGTKALDLVQFFVMKYAECGTWQV